ncbi:carbohydrate-binding protein, partial [Undibacterium sp.]|uniref:carbohydrate-binding protein n=1 Tax=Undibacterium sp. TaxID=1914977 RepID=UPI003752CE73
MTHTVAIRLAFLTLAASTSISAFAANNATTTTTTTKNPFTANQVNTAIVAACSSPAWNANTVYTGGMKASYDNKEWSAKWWTQGNTPSTSTDGPWKLIGDCGGGTGDPGSSDPVLTSVPVPTGHALCRPDGMIATANTNTPYCLAYDNNGREKI